MRQLFGVLLVITFAGCASTGGLVPIEDVVHDSLAKVDDGVRVFCGTTATAAGAFKVACDDVRRTLLPTLEGGKAFNRCVASGSVGCIGPLIEAIGNLIEQLKQLPQSETVKWVQELARAISLAFERTE